MVISRRGAIGIVAAFLASHLLAHGAHRLARGGEEPIAASGSELDSCGPIADRGAPSASAARSVDDGSPPANAFSVIGTSAEGDAPSVPVLDEAERANGAARSIDTDRPQREERTAPEQAPPPLDRLDSTTSPDVMSSHALLADHRTNRDYYHAQDSGRRLRTILELSGAGRDLDTIRDILGVEDDPALRAAAVERLGVSPSFAGTSLLVGALDDPSEAVRSSALRTLVDSGDRSLLPTLRERFHSLPAGAARDRFEEQLRRLELGASMQMDGLSSDR